MTRTPASADPCSSSLSSLGLAKHTPIDGESPIPHAGSIAQASIDACYRSSSSASREPQAPGGCSGQVGLARAEGVRAPQVLWVSSIPASTTLTPSPLDAATRPTCRCTSARSGTPALCVPPRRQVMAQRTRTRSPSPYGPIPATTPRRREPAQSSLAATSPLPAHQGVAQSIYKLVPKTINHTHTSPKSQESSRVRNGATDSASCLPIDCLLLCADIERSSQHYGPHPQLISGGCSCGIHASTASEGRGPAPSGPAISSIMRAPPRIQARSQRAGCLLEAWGKGKGTGPSASPRSSNARNQHGEAALILPLWAKPLRA
jgi:hypothetical protein